MDAAKRKRWLHCFIIRWNETRDDQVTEGVKFTRRRMRG